MQLIKYTLYITCLIVAGTSNTYSQAMLKPGYQSHCGYINAGALVFPENSAELTYEIKQKLPQLVYEMLLRYNCKVLIIGAGNANEAQQNLAKERVDAVAQYLEWYGVSKNRLMMQWGQAGDPNTVLYRSVIEGHEADDCIMPHFPRIKR